MSTDRPNIIFCMCDQMRPFELGCHGHPVVRTPNIDRLAREGVHFETACTSDPLCTPARSSFLTGQYARTCTGFLGCVGEPAKERNRLPHPTIAELLRRQGYETALIGKWHIGPHPLRVGFDSATFPKVHHLNTDQVYFEDEGEGSVVEGFAPEFEQRRLADFLAHPRENPFFLFYNISLPHMPFFDVPERWRTVYSPEEVILRENVWKDGEIARDEHWFKIYYYDYLYYKLHLPEREQLPPDFDIRTLHALYYGMITCVDEQIGRLMEQLDDNGLRDETLLVFTSDHGDNLGSHHLFNKVTANEESIRIPLMLHWPDRLTPRRNSTQVASLVDIVPTVLSLLDLPIPAHVQGTDLSPIAQGERDVPAGNASFIECHSGEIALRTPTHMYAVMTQGAPDQPQRTVADPHYQFYDLQVDPLQLNNLAATGEEATLAEELRERVLDWHHRTPWMQDLEDTLLAD